MCIPFPRVAGAVGLICCLLGLGCDGDSKRSLRDIAVPFDNNSLVRGLSIFHPDASVSGPVYVSQIAAAPGRLYVGGYVSADFPDVLYSLDVTDPEKPTVLGAVDDSKSYTGANGLIARGKRVYATLGRLEIFDVSSSHDPGLLGAFNYVKQGEFQDYVVAQSIDVQNDTAVIAARDGVYVADVGDPERIAMLGRLSTGAGVSAGLPAVAMTGKVAAVAFGGDYSDLGGDGTQGPSQASWIGGGLLLVDIADRENPRLLSKTVIEDDKNSDNAYSVWDVVVLGSTAFVGIDTGLVAIDISNAEAPKILSTLEPPTNHANTHALRRVDEGTVLALSGGDAMLIDVSDASAMNVMGCHRNPMPRQTTGEQPPSEEPDDYVDADVVGQHVFLAGQSSGLQILKRAEIVAATCE